MSTILQDNYWWSSKCSASYNYKVQNSLRFRYQLPNAAALTRPAVASPIGNDWTLSFWYKVTYMPSTPVDGDGIWLWGNADVGGPGYSFLHHHWDGYIEWIAGDSSTLGERLLRDPAAWYHIVATPNAGYINGVLDRTGPVMPNLATNTTAPFYIGGYPTHIGECVLSELHFVQGQTLDPSRFGNYDANGVWIPKDPQLETTDYGTHGYYLQMSDPADPGKDFSGNGNDFTAEYLQTADPSSSDYDLLTDSPTQNYAVFNSQPTGTNSSIPGDEPRATLSYGNLQAINDSSSAQTTPTTILLPGGKFYWENKPSGGITSATYPMFGIFDITEFINSGSASSYKSGIFYQPGGTLLVFSEAAYGITYGDPFTPSDTIGVTYDTESGEITFYKNGVSQGLATTVPAERRLNMVPGGQYGYVGANSGAFINCGQLPFLYTPPDGFEPIQTDMLPTPPVRNGTDGFRALTGAGADILSIAQGTADGTGIEGWGPTTGFVEGMWWIKDLTNPGQLQILDSTRGSNLAFECPNFGPEQAYVAPTGNSVAYTWAYDSSNPALYGFQIIPYIGDGIEGRTLAHSLGKTPEFMIFKNRDHTPPNTHFCIYHKDQGALYTAYLESNVAFLRDDDMFFDIEPTASEITVGDNYAINNLNENLVAYVWTSVSGYSSFGQYDGNGAEDGPFVYTGFRPAFILGKSASNNYDWWIYDSVLNPNNPSSSFLSPSTTAAETNNPGSAGADIDLLSNGFKIRTSAPERNSGQIIYAAFAEHPFGGQCVSPVTAR